MRWRRMTERGDRGAVAIEAALVLPLLMSLIFGALEIGGAMKSYSGASNAVRAGGRMASVAGNDAMADQLILERVAVEAAGIGKGEIQYVIIWNATPVGSQPATKTPPAACISLANAASAANADSLGVPDGGSANPAAGACNIYVRPEAEDAAFDKAQGEGPQPATAYFGCTAPGEPSRLDCNWPGKNRRVVVSPRGTPAAQAKKPDTVGIYIKAEHSYYTGLFGSTLTITDGAVNLLEPDSFGVNS